MRGARSGGAITRFTHQAPPHRPSSESHKRHPAKAPSQAPLHSQHGHTCVRNDHPPDAHSRRADGCSRRVTRGVPLEIPAPLSRCSISPGLNQPNHAILLVHATNTTIHLSPKQQAAARARASWWRP